MSWEPQLGASLLPGPSGRHQAFGAQSLSEAPGGAEASVGMSGQTGLWEHCSQLPSLHLGWLGSHS